MVNRSTAIASVVLAFSVAAGRQAPLNAQQTSSLELRVVTTTGEVPIGAIYVIVDSLGAQIQAGLLGENGRIEFTDVGRGPYTVSIRRMGIAVWTSAPITPAAFQAADSVLRVPIEPVYVGGVRTVASKACPGTEQAARRAVDLYLRVRNRLSEVVDGERNGYGFAVRVVQERLDGQVVRGGSRFDNFWLDTTVAVLPATLATPTPESLAERGFAQVLPNESQPRYFPPTPAVLLSDVFLATHCLTLIETGPASDSIGLGFSTREGRAVVDVEGVLWVSREGCQLRSMRFAYTGLRSFVQEHEVQYLVAAERRRMPGKTIVVSPIQLNTGRYSYGGTVRFRRLENGMVVVAGWEISVPVFHATGRVAARRYDLTPTATSLTTTAQLLAVVPPAIPES